MRKHPNLFRGLVILLVVVLLAVFVYSGIRIVDSLLLPEQPAETGNTISKTIVKDGVEYFPRQDVTTMLLMGIDRRGPVVASPSYNNTGAADMVALVIFDETNEAINVLMLNRDTMVSMPVLGLNGRPAGTATAQLALAHTYGTGERDSCENVKTTVSEFLKGIEINHYLSMNMDTVSLLTDAVGGVQVTVTEDFSAVDPTIPMGETVLNGSQAFNFVQNRKNVGQEMNVSRMERQKSYMKGFMKALDKKSGSASFVADTYASVEEYIVTNVSANSLSGMLNRYSDFELQEIVTPEGENIRANEYMEYHVDQDKLTDLVLRLLYSPKEI